jgi:P27 family predicted phage terminase small subunit
MRPISQEVKEQQGTFEPSKEGLEPIVYSEWDASRMPAAKAEWPPKIQAIWNGRCHDLNKVGYLTRAFLPLLERYCFAIMQAEQAEEALVAEGFVLVKVDVKGNTQSVISPWVSVLDNANKQIEKIGSKFGFTPLDVQKIPVVKKVEGDEKSLLK